MEADYDDSLKALIFSAISFYKANLSSASAFPDIATEAGMLTEVWKFACKEVEVEMETITLQMAKLVKSTVLSFSLASLKYFYWQITSCGSQLCGELKVKTCPLVEVFFGFESGLNRKIITTNCRTAENLKEGKGFIYKVILIHLWSWRILNAI